LFVGIFAIPYLLVLCYRCLGLIFQSPTPQIANLLLSLLWTLGFLLVAIVASAASQAATVLAVSQVYLDRPTSVAEAYSRVTDQILPVVWLSLIVGLCFIVGLILLVVPGILVILIWALAVPVKVLEEKSVMDSLTRSAQLTQGSRGRIFVTGLLVGVLAYAVSLLIQAPVWIAAMVAMFGHGQMRQLGLGWQVALLVSQFISQCLVGPIATIAFSLIYYDQRVRKEAFDLQLMMSTLDGAPVPTPAPQIGA